MKPLKRITLAAFFLLALAAAAPAQDRYYGGFEGRWEGTLKTIDAKAYDAEIGRTYDEGWKLRISIQSDIVRVFSWSEADKKWVEVKSGRFRIAAHKTNAVIYVTDSAEDVEDKTGSGGWVETWNFTTTKKNRDTLYVAFARTVNNYLRADDYRNAEGRKTGRFFLLSFGEMTRLPPR